MPSKYAKAPLRSILGHRATHGYTKYFAPKIYNFVAKYFA